jgi:hypothetical protein
MAPQLRREIRLLKLYAGGSTLALVFLSAAAFRQAQTPPARQKFDQIDVERINVVEKDGRVRLVIANSERQAVTVVDGQSILPNRKRDAGLIFFNDEGDENGGMTWSGRRENGVARASAGLSFDQYKQDETVTLRYTQNGTERLAGLTVADRPEASIAAAARMNDAATDEARAKIGRSSSTQDWSAARPACSPARIRPELRKSCCRTPMRNRGSRSAWTVPAAPGLIFSTTPARS